MAVYNQNINVLLCTALPYNSSKKAQVLPVFVVGDGNIDIPVNLYTSAFII
jgi:hypothetical protein